MPSEADIHSEISDTARKIAELESNFDENEEVITPTHLDKLHSLVMPLEKSDKVGSSIQVFQQEFCNITCNVLLFCFFFVTSSITIKWALSWENLSSGFLPGKTQTGLHSYRD